MSHVLNGRFLVDMHWEPLLGLERETREVSRLLKRREANAHVIAETAQLDRILGLAQIEQMAGVPAPALVAFASAFADAVEHPRFLFSHQFSDDDVLAGKVLLIGARDKRVDLDRVVPVDDAVEIAEGFLRLNAADGVAIMGAEGRLGVTHPYTLEEAITTLEKSDLSLHAIQVKRRLDKRFVRLGACAAGALVVGVATVLLWPDAPRPLPVVRRVPAVDHSLVYMADVATRLRAETEHGGPYYARFVLDTVRQLAVDQDGWLLQHVTCERDHCTVRRVRGAGADTKSLLAKHAEVTLDEKLETAVQRIAAPDSAEQSVQVEPIANAVFQKQVVSRLQALADYGMTPRITAAVEILKAPAEVHTPVEVPRMGAWELSGDLAFLDSIALMVIQSKNMVWRTLDVKIDGVAPTFVAKGAYFVL